MPRDLGINRNTVRAALRREGPPLYVRPPGPSKLDPFCDLIDRPADVPEPTAKRLLAEKLTATVRLCSLVTR
jgi:hypothetical protein